MAENTTLDDAVKKIEDLVKSDDGTSSQLDIGSKIKSLMEMLAEKYPDAFGDDEEEAEPSQGERLFGG